MNDITLNYHLMHPGAESSPGDPNAAFCINGVYHLHYILKHPFAKGESFSFIHVTSPDMLHWTWQATKLQPAFTGHGMYSGTGFITKDDLPAVIYHGQGSDRNHISIAKDTLLSAWEKPYPVEVRTPGGSSADIARYWDPDCFLIDDTYYAISGGSQQPLFKSTDLRKWTLVGDFLSHNLPDTMIGEDISCPNFFPLGDKWILLCISHSLGCRCYIGDWDGAAEQFVPQKHVRMNWRRDEQPIYGLFQRTDFFAPESVLTTDGRRVMWAWVTSVGIDGALQRKTIQSLPRELSLPDDGILRIRPLSELESLRFAPNTFTDITIGNPIAGHRDKVPPTNAPALHHIVDLDGDCVEIRIVIPREQAARKLFGFTLFEDGSGGGLPIMLRPENGTLRVGTGEAPFAVTDLPEGEDIELRIFIDKYIVEVFANDRQALIAAHMELYRKSSLHAFTVGIPTTIKRLDIWRLKPTNQGFLDARDSRIWEPDRRR
jgi:beta-fructofuranosidase